MKVVGYVRASSQEQKQQGIALPEQTKMIKRWCKANGHTLVDVFQDDAVSGTNGIESRVGLPLAVAAIESGRAEGLVTTTMSRLARALHVQEGILSQLWRYRATVFTVEQGEVPQDAADDPMIKFVRQVMGAAIELDAAMIRARMEAGRRAKAERGGHYLHGAPPFGFRADPETNELVKHPEEQATITRIRALLDQEPRPSLRQVAATLNEEGRPAKRSPRWHPETLRQVISRL